MSDIYNINKEKLKFATNRDISHDKRLDTKPVGYLEDAFKRFKKNKGSIVAAWIVILLVLYAIVGPLCIPRNYTKAYVSDSELQRYQYLAPKVSFLDGTGFWDGTTVKEITEVQYAQYVAREYETGLNPIQKIVEKYEVKDSMGTKTMLKVKFDTYNAISCFEKQLSYDEYVALQQWQKDNGIQVIMPYVNASTTAPTTGVAATVRIVDANIWYNSDRKGKPIDLNGKPIKKLEDYIPAYLTVKNATIKDDKYTGERLHGDPGIENPDSPDRWIYAKVTGTTLGNYNVRVNAYNYFIYKYDFEPSFVFGTEVQGYDIFSRLASGARFSLLFAVAISAINLIIGAFYGAVEGYYGGATDLIMERISDILSAIPSMVVTVLFNLHLSGAVGPVISLLFSFILTGWIGMASRVRMQFYRFKNQEYVLAARTLGARDSRIMFKHIFPNSLGTIITGSVLVIPGVIFSETSLTYLGIINLDSPTRASVGAMLNAGKLVMTKFPHVILFPALFIALLMVSFNLFGNGLRDAFNPSLRGAED